MGGRNLERQIAGMPARPGIYAFRDRRGRLLYVGKAVNLRRRAGSYLDPDGGHTGYTRSLRTKAARVEFLETGSELEALIAEARAIRSHQPAFNVVGRHSRHYFFVKVTSERFPRIQAVREIAPDGAAYYGPFPPELDVDEALAGLQAILKWRRCEQLERDPCLHHQVGHCLAPCADFGVAPYRGMLRVLDGVLRGDGEGVLAALDEKMRRSAAALQFERAAALRDRRKALTTLLCRSPFLTLDVVYVEPAGFEARLLALRAGRLVLARTVSRATRDAFTAAAAAFLSEAFHGEPPAPARSDLELREVDVVSAFLARKEESGRLVRISGRPAAEKLAAVVAAVRKA
jgi:excinuclease ABC subunit C